MVFIEASPCWMSYLGWYSSFTNVWGRVGGFVISKKGNFSIDSTEYKDPIEKEVFPTFQELCRYIVKNNIKLGTTRLKRIVKLGLEGRVAFKLSISTNRSTMYWPGSEPASRTLRVKEVVKNSKKEAFIDLLV